jgi:hypothetical protein
MTVRVAEEVATEAAVDTRVAAEAAIVVVIAEEVGTKAAVEVIREVVATTGIETDNNLYITISPFLMLSMSRWHQQDR